MTVTFRPAADADIPRICSFVRNAQELFFFFPAATWPLTPEQLRDSIAQRSDSTVLERDGQVVGFANFYRWEQGGTCTIGNVIVDPEVRSVGLGAQLIGQMIYLARSRHQARDVTLSCFNSNVAGLLFYPKLGFVPFAIEERKDKQQERVALIHLRYSPS
ncbi:MULTISPECIES: GNAT family N-acetyltransferase [Pseudomonas]|uniref:GNAT family N-acetyltransferase n=1 Tax=Pseudomonas sessilinigenes TaxID=658629 RepID=A0ABX8MNH7_9PSED|nr:MULTISPECIES: GNAT family N-acetyltransferase [Pseudomonas]AZC26102.1 Protein export cytoplasm protein SecA ATPase RNA helicase [Pseudomonas sessilinigenes]QIH10802.1 GNAT family N-acetyltransferase [Pseudomonas sp. BIOMIG1BAC]QXH39868.1 GNAT family N-acetyltransferase [Pseudomonas sessilinigenes]